MTGSNHLKRDIGLAGLTFLTISSMLGAGWLFTPMLAAQQAGPAAILAWLIGGFIMMALALTFAEISAMFPLPGGIATIPQLSHGNTVSAAMGWTAWLGYCFAAPIEVETTLRYLSDYMSSLFQESGDKGLTLTGSLAGIALMAVFVVINALGVGLFAKINSAITVIKLAVPMVIIAAFVTASFDAANFSSGGGFAPTGLHGILAALTSGGIISSLIGFRHVIEMAGEVKNPGRSIPIAIIFGISVCMLLYIALQTALVGAIPATSLEGGWNRLSLSHSGGPLAAVATVAGLLWVVSMMNAASVISPFGGALVATASNARLVMVLTNSRLAPLVFSRLSNRGVPFNALLLNFIVGCVLLQLFDFNELLTVVTSLIVLSFIIGPVSLVSLRRRAPHVHRPLKLPFVTAFGYGTFTLATLIVYWSGWDALQITTAALAGGAVLYLTRLRYMDREELDLREALWLAPYSVGLMLISWLGDFGGIGLLPSYYDILACAVLAAACYWLAVNSCLGQQRFETQSALLLATIGQQVHEPDDGKKR